jgi:heme-degrading monooxygenase HmoA
MSVKIFIKRVISEDKIPELTVLLKRLRSVTLTQPGYISGQTLKRLDKSNESMVISTWRSIEDWNNWIKNEKRIAIQSEIDSLIGDETEYAIYE